MRVDTDEPEIIERIAALDVGKAEVVLRPGARPGRPANAGGPHHLDDDRPAARAGRLAGRARVSRVVMEATSDYWRAPFHLLEDRFET
jgi:transposase